jgi:hypothetical protein
VAPDGQSYTDNHTAFEAFSAVDNLIDMIWMDGNWINNPLTLAEVRQNLEASL